MGDGKTGDAFKQPASDKKHLVVAGKKLQYQCAARFVWSRERCSSSFGIGSVVQIMNKYVPQIYVTGDY